jgi:hypothetical protein
MNLLKTLALTLILLTAFSAYSHESQPFICTTKLDYKVDDDVKTVDLTIHGRKSETGTLTGGIFVVIGEKIVSIRLPAANLSNGYVFLKGGNTKEKTSVELTYAERSDGQQSGNNKAVVTIRTNGHSLKATNRRLTEGHDGEDHAVTCTIP